MNDRRKIKWHTAFNQAMKAELIDYNKQLNFIEGYTLTAEPLLENTLIIEKRPKIVINRNVARTFRAHNVVEYRSPDDSLTFDDYQRAFACLYMYASLAHINVNELSLTLAAYESPYELLKCLRYDSLLLVDKQSEGIHYVIGERVPVQIIETKALRVKENLWLKSLRYGLKPPVLKRLVKAGRRFGNELNDYIYAVFNANMLELEREYDKSWMEDYFMDTAKRLGYVEKNKAARETAKRMLLDGESVERISRWVLLPIEELRSIEDTL